MRILFPTLVPFPSSEAPAVQIAHMAQAFARLGHEVLLIAPAPGSGTVADVLGEEPRFATRVLSRRVRRGQSYVHAVRVGRLAQSMGPDLVFARNLRGCLLPALRGVPTVLEAHTLSSLDGPQDRWVMRRLLRARGFRGVVAISAALATDLDGAFRIGTGRLLVAHDAVQLAGSRERPVSHSARPHVVYTGSLFPGKGADLLIDVAAHCPWARFSIAGGPPERVALLKRRMESTGLTNVSLLGEIRPVDARALQAEADVLVAPFARRVESDSGHDIARWTSPMKLFEYMASGRPMIVSDLPVLREVLRPDVDALMVAPGDINALIAALERLRDDRALGARLAASALERARTEFTWDIRARRILERFGA
jgi:glycosyltransferase involved in cell wall biosynthesis